MHKVDSSHVMTDRYTYRFEGSTEEFRAPAGLSAEQIALHAGRLYHPSIVRARQMADGVWATTNGRRGCRTRFAVVHVREVAS